MTTVCMRATWFICFTLLFLQSLCAAEEPQFTETREPIAIGQPAPQRGWLEAPTISAETWKPVEQPNLAQELDHAERLTLKGIAPAPRQVVQGHLPYFCPNPDGKSWDILFPYRKKYLSEGQVLVHDFGSGESKMFRYGVTEGENIVTPHSTDFHMKSSYYVAKKLVFVLPTLTHGLVMLVYDPAVNDFVSRTTPFTGKFELYALDIGDDERLYGIGQPDSHDGFVPFIFDPKTYETIIYEQAGPGQKNPFPYYRSSALHGDWMVCKYGHEPWRLMAFNFKTREFRHLATSEEIKGDYQTIAIARHPGGVSGHIRQAERVDGIPSFDKDQFDFWFVDGKVVPRTSDIAPWSNEPVQRQPRPKDRFREFQRWPKGFAYDVPPPEIKPDSSGPVDVEGHVAMPYRMPGEDEWKTLDYQVILYPGVVRRLIEVNADTLFAVDEGYGQHIFYDLKEARLKRYLVQRVSPYAVGVVDDRLYVSGYPTFVTVEYPLDKLSETTAPKLLGNLGVESDTHSPLGGLCGGADGCVYFAGTTFGRRRDGGGLAWYDMSTGQVGSKALVDHRVFWITSADRGRYILLSCKSAMGSRIFCWDTAQKKFVYDIPSPTDSHAGPLEEALPGLVIGHAIDGDGGLLYGLQPATGKVLWRKKVPAGPITSLSQVRRHAYSFRRGPEGFVWASFGDVLVRIDPRSAYVTPVGKMDPVQIAFAGGRVYAAGSPNLRKLEGLTVETTGR